jgi:hypothetical protein
MEKRQKAAVDDFGLEEQDSKIQSEDPLVKERLKKQSSYTYWV